MAYPPSSIDDVELFGEEVEGEDPDLFADGHGEVIELDDEAEEEAAPLPLAPDPGAPTDEEREEHRTGGHCPYRSWCDHCVEGRATGEQHKASAHGVIPTVAFDYLIVTKDGQVLKLGEKTAPENVLLKILVVKDTKSKAIFAYVVDRKGVEDDRYSVSRLQEDIS